MKRLLCSLALLFVAAPASAQDTPAADAPKVDLRLSTDATLDGKPEKANYVHYFVWQQLAGKGVNVASGTECHAEKWMKKTLDAEGLTLYTHATEVKPTLTCELTVTAAYEPHKMELDGKEAIVGHKWVGSVTGELKDASGAVVHTFDLHHFWGTNTQVAPERGRLEYLRHLSTWVLLDLYSNPKVRALFAEDKVAAVDEDLANFKAQKAKLYDDSRKDTGKGAGKE